jgi:hypothetical protein
VYSLSQWRTESNRRHLGYWRWWSKRRAKTEMQRRPAFPAPDRPQRQTRINYFIKYIPGLMNNFIKA